MTSQPAPESTNPYGTGAQAAPPRRVRVPHLIAMKERGEKWAMLTAYDMYAAEIFDEAGIPVLLVGDSAGNNVYGGPAVRLLPGEPAAGARHRDALHEGGTRARGETGGREGDGAGGRVTRPRGHPGHGPHRLHAAERARARGLQGPGSRRRGGEAAGRCARARSGRQTRQRNAGHRWPIRRCRKPVPFRPQ